MRSKKETIVPQFVYKIDKALGDNFEAMCSKLVALSKALPYRVLRMVFFGNPQSQEEYIEHLNIISKVVTRNFGKTKPVYGYVAQPPLIGELVLETTRLVDNENLKVKYKKCSGMPYIKITSSKDKYLFVGGVMGRDIIKQSIPAQCKEVFKMVGKVLSKESMKPSDIVRQWNYIEKITHINDGYQNYQALNDARSHFYLKEKWVNGYPAATGIGTRFGGIMVDFDAVKTKTAKIVSLDNDLQVPAHVYSQDVLLGEEDKKLKQKTTPKFERGKALASEKFTMGYISGTAAIRGEESLEEMDIIRQTEVTMENIDYLTSKENLKKYGADVILGKRQYKTLRVYLKNSCDTIKVNKFMNDKYPEANKCYLLADVCRDELLIEIEGIVCYQ